MCYGGEREEAARGEEEARARGASRSAKECTRVSAMLDKVGEEAGTPGAPPEIARSVGVGEAGDVQ